jgi:hypothetical protein
LSPARNCALRSIKKPDSRGFPADGGFTRVSATTGANQ